MIRAITNQDISTLIELGQDMHQESAYAFLPYNKEKVHQFILDMLNDPETQCGFIAEKNGYIIGMMAGYLIDYFFCDEVLACDTVLFVRKPYRGSLTAFRLIRTFRQWALQHNAVELSLGVSTDINVEKTGKLYQKMGLKYVGGVYKQRLNF